MTGTKLFRPIPLCFALLSAILSGAALTGCTDQAPPSGTEQQPQTATSSGASLESVTPSPRVKEYEWMSVERWHTLHQEDVAIAREGGVELLFIGDSITEGWPQPLWAEYFGAYDAANFAIGGDKTENLLWRLNNGSVGQLDPEVVVLLIGTNNFGLSNHEPEAVSQGVVAVTNALLEAFPNAKLLLNGIFPTKQSADHPMRDKVREVNEHIKTLAEHERVQYLDIGDQLVEENGEISADIMPDYLHLSEQGYRIWGNNLKPILADWLEE